MRVEVETSDGTLVQVMTSDQRTMGARREQISAATGLHKRTRQRAWSAGRTLLNCSSRA